MLSRQKITTKFLSFLLAVCLLTGLFPNAGFFAIEADAAGLSHGTCTISGTTVTVKPDQYYDLCTLSYLSSGNREYVDCSRWTKTSTGYTISIPSGVTAVSATYFCTSVWDGSLDVSWYSKNQTTFHLTNPAQLAGLAAIVNGIYNSDIDRDHIKGDISCIVDNKSTASDSSGSYGLNKSTPTYHYGADDFNGKTVYLDCDMDMGGVQSNGVWTGSHNFMPIGGQYLMDVNSSLTKLGSSFNGTLDGQGYTVKNIYCNRYNPGENYGDGASVGLIGRLGVHDNDPASLRAYQPTVRNIVVTGYIYARRSVGGIVGKIGKTQVNNATPVGYGALIENCANYCTVISTDAKGAAGICGSAWNGGIIRNCYNAGTVRSSYGGPCGGIVGYNEVTIENCYNIGLVTNTAADRYAEAIGSHNGGRYTISNCYWLEGTAANGGYYKIPEGCENQVTELTSASMKSADFVTKLNAGGNAFAFDSNGTNKGYPVLRCTLHKAVASVIGFNFDTSEVATDYIVGATPDLSKLKIWANLSDGTKELVRTYQVNCQETEYTVDGTYCNKSPVLAGSGSTDILITGSYYGKTFSTTVKITIDNNVTPLSLSVSGFDVHTYAAGEMPDLTGTVVTVSYKSNTTGKYGARQIADYSVSADSQNANGTLKSNAKKLTFSVTLAGKTVSDEEEIRVVSSAPSVTDGVCTISSADDLVWFASQINERDNYTLDAVLTKDISFATTALTPIGVSSKVAYAGCFDGNGHTITLGSFISSSLDSKTDGLALFGYTKNAEIKNLIVNGKVSGTTQIAGIISQDTGYTKVTSCRNKANIVSTSGCAGGITAMVSGPDSVYTSCSNNGTVSASSSKSTGYGTGGIIGHITSGCTLSECSNTGTVNAASSPVGGIAGEISSAQVTVTGCENSGKVMNQASASDFADAGGILGTVTGDQVVTVSTCENKGDITSSATSVGGIVGGSGISSRLNISLCSNSGTIKGVDAVGGIVGNVAYTIASCFNKGNVTATGANAASAYTGTGGIIGCSKAAIAIKYSYNTGKVTASANAGGLVGCAFNFITSDNDYYLSGTAVAAANAQDARYISSLSSCAKLESDMKSAAFINLLGSGFISDSNNINGGYPVINKNASIHATEDNFTIPSGQSVSILKITKAPNITTYASGEIFDASGMEVELTLSNGEKHTVSGSKCTVSSSPLTASTKWITVSYGGCEATTDVTVLSCKPLEKVNGIYQISTADELQLFSAYVNERGEKNACAVLTKDITASGSFIPLGTQSAPFAGTLDGSSHKLTVTISSKDGSTGIVAYASEGAAITNLTVAGTVSGSTNVGAIVGEGTNVNIKNCKNTAAVTGTGTVGGIAGSMNGGSIIGCINAASLQEAGRSNVGGIVGIAAENCEISGCSNTGSITAGTSSGGIVGSGDAKITTCTNSGALNAAGYSNIGGIIGNGSGTVSRCTNTGKISAGNNAGGISGAYEGSISGSTNSGDITGSSYVGGVTGAFKGTEISIAYNIANVTGETQVGGIAGALSLGNITSSGSSGKLAATTKATTSGNGLGGIIGYLDSGETCTVKNCVFAGTLNAENAKVSAGTMAGYAATSIILSGCSYASGSVSSDIGFILGTATKTGSADEKNSLFLDVPESAWYADAVDYVYANNLFAGYGNGLFGPEDYMTRAMFVTVLNNYCGKPSPVSLNAFSDVSSSAWYAKQVNWAYENKIVVGTAPSVFSPNENITLESMVMVLYNYCGGTPGSKAPTEYGEVSSWASGAMSWAYENGLFEGIGGTLTSKGAATRAQVAAMMSNLNHMKK